jgi:hypothetical protein
LEIPYFEAPFFQNSDERELWRSFQGAEPNDRLGLKRADYLARPEVAANLAATIPDAVLIAVLRPPVQRTVSAVYWYMLHGQLPVVGLNRNLRTILDGLAAGTLNGPALEIVTNSRYAEALDRYRRLWPDERLVLTDSRRIDDDATYRHLAEALALPGTRWPAIDSGERSNSGVYNLTRLRLLRVRSHLVYDWRKDTRFRFKPRPAQYRPVRAAVAQIPKLIDRVALEPRLDNSPEVLDRSIEDELNELYAPDLERLATVHGIDLRGDVGDSSRGREALG